MGLADGASGEKLEVRLGRTRRENDMEWRETDAIAEGFNASHVGTRLGRDFLGR